MPSIIDHIDQLLIERYLGKLVYSRSKHRSFVAHRLDWEPPDDDGNGKVTLSSGIDPRDRRSFSWYDEMPEAFENEAALRQSEFYRRAEWGCSQ